MPEEGEDLVMHITKKYGPALAAKFSKPDNPLYLAGQKVGIAFTPNRKIMPTYRSHQVMEFANKLSFEKGADIMQALFKNYFEGGKNVYDPNVLLEICSSYFNDNEITEIINILANNSLLDEVNRKVDNARQKLRVTGVPYFIIGQQKFQVIYLL